MIPCFSMVPNSLEMACVVCGLEETLACSYCGNIESKVKTAQKFDQFVLGAENPSATSIGGIFHLTRDISTRVALNFK